MGTEDTVKGNRSNPITTVVKKGGEKGRNCETREMGLVNVTLLVDFHIHSLFLGGLPISKFEILRMRHYSDY